MSADGKLLLLGPLPMHGMAPERDEYAITRSIHEAFGLACVRGSSGEHRLERHGRLASRLHGVIDRYNTVGPRRRDGVHPYFHAQFAVAELLLNVVCDPGESTS